MLSGTSDACDTVHRCSGLVLLTAFVVAEDDVLDRTDSGFRGTDTFTWPDQTRGMTHRILVPFELPDAAPLAPVLVEDLADMEIVALGHFELPEQTPSEAARAQFEDEARAELEDLVAPLREAGATVTTRVVFGKDRAKTIDRVAIEEECDAELDPAETDRIRAILVPIIDTSNVDRLSDFVAALYEDGRTQVTLFHVLEPDSGEEPDAVAAMLADARARMIDRGFEEFLLDSEHVEAPDHDEAILERAETADAVVMGEADPGGIHERIFGTLADRIARRTGDPVIVVRHDR